MTWREEQIRKIAREVIVEESNHGFTLQQKQIIQSWIEKHEHDFLHTTHGHAEPAPIKPVKPRITVLTFDKAGKQGSYSFIGNPNIPRIERETIGEGMLAAIVLLHSKYALLIQSHEIFPIRLMSDGQGWEEHKDLLSTFSHGWHIEKSKLNEWIVHIQKAIAEWREKQPKQEHYDVEPKWQPGDLAFNTAWGEIVRIISVESELIRSIPISNVGEVWGAITRFRPLTDEDWIVEIAGVRVRAAKIEDDGIRVWFNDNPDTFSRDECPAIRELLRAKGVPIKPFDYKKK